METRKQQYSWWVEDDSCVEKYDSMDEAIADAQNMYDSSADVFSDAETSPIIKVGMVTDFDFKDATKHIVEGIEDAMYELVDNFCSGCDFEHESYAIDKEKFINEATGALYPIIEKHMFINPEWKCTCDAEYDLKERKYLKIWMK